jgi:hypothetical protein
MSVPTLTGAGVVIIDHLRRSTTVTTRMVPVDMAGVVEDRVNGTQLTVCSSSPDDSIRMIGTKNVSTKMMMMAATTKSHRGCNYETE